MRAGRKAGGGGRGRFENWDAETFTAEHEPDDTHLPIAEAVEAAVRVLVEVGQRAGGYESFAPTVATGEQEWNVGDLFGDDVDGAVDPDDLLVGIREGWALMDVVTAEPGGQTWINGFLDWWINGRGVAGDGDVEAEEAHGVQYSVFSIQCSDRTRTTQDGRSNQRGAKSTEMRQGKGKKMRHELHEFSRIIWMGRSAVWV